jgi:DNA-binding CsgD family transcriptional regulator
MIHDGELTARLSPRERDVLGLMADGLSMPEIAERLAMTTKTVYSHRRRICRKLETRSVALLTKVAIRMGLSEI